MQCYVIKSLSFSAFYGIYNKKSAKETCMRKIIAALIAFAFIIPLYACAAPGDKQEEAAEPAYKTLSPEDAKELIGTKGVFLVDVRTPEEYLDGHIPQSLLLPQDEIQQKALEVLPDKYATVIVYCRSGRRSALAAKELIGLGYKCVYDLGGILDWPYDTVKGEQQA
jgi:phage shock protein E